MSSPAGISGPVFAIVKIGASRGGVRGDVEPAARDVVTDGVRDQVRDEALDKLRIAGRPCGLERRRAPESVMVVGSQHFGGSRGEVDGLPTQTSALAPGEGEQRLEQPFLALAGDDDALAHLAQRGACRRRVGERDLRKRALEGDLATQLMSGVGEETLLRVNRDGCGSESARTSRRRPRAHRDRAREGAAPPHARQRGLLGAEAALAEARAHVRYSRRWRSGHRIGRSPCSTRQTSAAICHATSSPAQPEQNAARV